LTVLAHFMINFVVISFCIVKLKQFCARVLF